MNDAARPRSENMTPFTFAANPTVLTKPGECRRWTLCCLMAGKGCCLTAPSHLDDLAENRKRDFCRRFGGDIEPDRRVNPVDDLLSNFFLVAKSLKTSLDPPPAADHADVLCLTVNDLAQARLVVFVPSGDQDDIGRRRNRHLLKHLRHISDQHFVSIREALAIGISQSIIGYDDIEIQNLRYPHERHGDMAGAHHNQFWWSRHDFEEYFQLASALRDIQGDEL